MVAVEGAGQIEVGADVQLQGRLVGGEEDK